jgi:hypothetical protein
LVFSFKEKCNFCDVKKYRKVQSNVEKRERPEDIKIIMDCIYLVYLIYSIKLAEAALSHFNR